LCSFAEDDNRRFQFCVITGPAGIGKSKLVFHFSRIYQQKKDWLVRNLNQKPLQGLCKKKNWTTEKNILLIIDYANEQELLTDLLSKLSRLKEEGYWRKIRLILIAREGTSPSIYNSHQKDFPKWYMDIVHDDWAINDHLFLNEFIDLCGLTIEDCSSLHIAYATNHLKRNITLKDESNIKQLIEQEVLDEDGLARPLYALFVIDLYYRNPDVRSWDLDSIQEQIYLRDWVKWKTEICGKRNKRENVFIALTNLLLYATIFNKWESSITLPEPLDKDCKIVFNAANAYATDYKSKWFKILTGKNVFFNGESVLVRLTPDVVGEYYALKRLSSFDKSTLHSWATLMTAQLVDCREFFIRAIQDFGNNKTFIEIFLKIFRVMSELIAKDDNDTHKAFASILETFFRNYKGNEDDRIFQNISDVINQYTEDNKNNCAYAAELTLLFHENRPHIGFSRRVEHFECIEPLYNRWPESRKIASAYISFLGDIAASRIGANAPAYSDSYITKFEKLLNLAKSTDYVIKKAFIPVLIKAIERADSVHDWKRSTFMEDFFLKEVMEQCGDELALDCIGKFDSVIISLAKQRADLVQAVTPEPISESKQLTIQEIDQKLEKEIAFFRHVINSNSNPSVNFVWTYVGKLSMVTKNLFIHECIPHNELLFQYMLRKLQEVYTMHYNSNTSSILAWRASRALDEFCDAKSEAIPPFIRVLCILNKPN
jgi:energy-coupling factor transporter ATP-binding protein EcfA2